jgi:hypothetical protein
MNFFVEDRRPVILKNDDSRVIQLTWETLAGSKFLLELDALRNLRFRSINGASVDFKKYEV